MKRTQEEQERIWIEKSSHQSYILGEEKSQFAVSLIVGLAPALDSSILELGCNVGRNLEYLRRAGYKNLAGIEISRRALPMREEHFPELDIDYYEGRIEDRIFWLSAASIDIVFSMAVLQHIHPNSEWIFPDIARVAKRGIVTIEGETRDTEGIWPRNYGEIFTDLGWTEATTASCGHVEGLGDTYIARTFVKEEELP